MVDGYIATPEECIAWGLAERDRKLDELAIFALVKIIEERGGILPGDPSFMRDWTADDVAKFRGELVEILGMTITNEDVKALYPDAVEDQTEDWEKYFTATLTRMVDEHKYDFLDLGKTGSIKDIEAMITAGCRNFAEWHVQDCANNAHTPQGVEAKEFVYFKDEFGEDMPIPVKGILDRWDIDSEGGVIVKDYKSVDRFNEDEEYKYEMSAGAYFFVVQAITGKIPKAIEYIEIMKKEPKVVWLAEPGRKMLQADLKEEATKAGLEFGKFVKNAELEEMLLAHGLMGKQNPVRVIRIDYTEKAYVVNAFLYIYKSVLNQLAFTDMFLPNLRGWQAKEAWADLVEEVEGGKDWMDQIMAEGKKRAETSDETFTW